jgi:hypothetical protein
MIASPHTLLSGIDAKFQEMHCIPCLINFSTDDMFLVNSTKSYSSVRLLKVAHQSSHINPPITCCDSGKEVSWC